MTDARGPFRHAPNEPKDFLAEMQARTSHGGDRYLYGDLAEIAAIDPAAAGRTANEEGEGAWVDRASGQACPGRSLEQIAPQRD
jgi:hypothetical protein